MKNALVAVWRFLASVGIWIFLMGRMYQFKSWIHRRLFDRQYDNTPITVYPTVKALQEWVAKQEWVKDDIRSGWDAVCTPNKVQAVGQGGDHRVGDCDEFAIYITAAIEKALATGTMTEMNIANPRFFTVTWMERNGMPDGHNVCLVERPQPGGLPPKYSYMDYGMPSEPPLDTPAQVAVLIAQSYAGWSGTGHGSQESGVLCWGIQRSNLSPVQAGLGSGWNKGRNQK